jgi:predicted regulator of Ras-like GTPase activity (Roadblock/LC7/MglB family)
MFSSLFKRMRDVLPGLRAVAVVGDDGIEVDRFVLEDLPHEVLSAEMNGVLRTLKRLRGEIALGSIHEVVIRTEAENILLCALAEGLFVLVVTDPATATGRSRFEVQRLAHEFQDVLK